MPKINIRESDNTKAGLGIAYANYSVLIPGFMGSQGSNPIEADANGVYEFTTQEDFIRTIGAVSPDATTNHYGNRMAYELLGMGLTVIYIPITTAEVGNLGNLDFWEPFYDKASYDFRFVTHGLLAGDSITTANIQIANLASYVNMNKPNEDEMTTGSGRGDCIALLECPVSEYTQSDIPRQVFGAISKPDSDAISDNYSYTVAGDTITIATGSTLVKDKPIILVIDYNNIKVQEVTVDIDEDNLPATCAKAIKYYKKSTAPCATCGINIESDLEINAPFSATNYCNLIEITITTTSTEPITFSNNHEITIEAKAAAVQNMSAATANIKEYFENLDSSINFGIRGTYCAATVPCVDYKMTKDNNYAEETGGIYRFPGAFHYLACFKNALDKGFAEWYAAAGYTRGVTNYNVHSTPIKLGEAAIRILEPRSNKNPDGTETGDKCAVNVIACFRGVYYLWGNRTMHKLNTELTAQHFLNIRQLCTTLKKQLYIACRTLTYEPNSDVLWTKFCDALRPTLQRMVSDQGIKDYKVEKIATSKKATLKAKVRIIPIEAVEDFILEVSLEDNFGDISVSVAE